MLSPMQVLSCMLAAACQPVGCLDVKCHEACGSGVTCCQRTCSVASCGLRLNACVHAKGLLWCVTLGGFDLLGVSTLGYVVCTAQLKLLGQSENQ
jgi:hypothetical protein